MHELCTAYLVYVRTGKRLSQRTAQLYEQELKKLDALCQEQQLAPTQVQYAHVRRWTVLAHSKGQAPRTLAIQLSSWRGFYKWLVANGHTAHNPCLDVKPPKQAKPLPKALSVDAAVALANFSLANPPQKGANLEALFRFAKESLVVELLYGCGLRVSELVGLDLCASDAAMQGGRGWIDSEGGEVHVFGKGSKRRMVPLGKQALQAYLAYQPLREEMGSHLHSPAAQLDRAALLVNTKGKRLTRHAVWVMLRSRSLTANLDSPVHPHMLRHSFASHVLQSSHDLRAVQELLGHSSIASTQTYTRLDFQHLAQVYDNSHPRAKLTKDET